MSVNPDPQAAAAQSPNAMPPISCQVLCASGTPLPGIHISLEYEGSGFEAITSSAGVVEGWCSRANYRSDKHDATESHHCSLKFSSFIWGVVHAEHLLPVGDWHLFVLRWGVANFELTCFSTPPLAYSEGTNKEGGRTDPVDQASPGEQRSMPSTPRLLTALPSPDFPEWQHELPPPLIYPPASSSLMPARTADSNAVDESPIHPLSVSGSQPSPVIRKRPPPLLLNGTSNIHNMSPRAKVNKPVTGGASGRRMKRGRSPISSANDGE